MSSWKPRAWRNFKLSVRWLLGRVGWVRFGPFPTLARDDVWRWPQGHARSLWRNWVRQPAQHFEVPERRQVEVLRLLSAALNELPVDQVVYIDVGAGRGDVLDLFEKRSGLRKGVFSVGIDPVDERARRDYSRFVLGAISNRPEGRAEFFRYSSSDCSSLKRMNSSNVSHDPSDIGKGKYFTSAIIEHLEETLSVPTFRLATLMGQYGLAQEVLHFVKIDAQGSDLDAFLSLGELARNCLFLRLETVLVEVGAPKSLLYEDQTTFAEDRVAIEAAGFRLLAISPFGVTPEADVTFVNLKLFCELWPSVAAASRPPRPARPAPGQPF